MLIVDQIVEGESKTLEFKLTLPQSDQIAKTVVAFSNTAGGKLLIGINNNREIIGIKDDKIFEIKDKIASIVNDQCHPQIIPEIYTQNISGKQILIIEVSHGNLKPYFVKTIGKADGTFLRIGATNRSADWEMIQELDRQRRHVSYDEEICFDNLFEELDLSPLYAKFESVGKKLSQDKLLNLKLIKYENDKLYPTNALMIILGKFYHCTIKCARFRGTTMELFTDKKEYAGDIFSNLENAQNFVLNHINIKGEIKGLQRTDTYEIPIPAIRESIMNAIVHRDYVNQGRDIKIGVYDDIVNIVSPGSLPFGLSMQDALNGRSETRNRAIARVFKELGLIEQWGSGLNRILNSCLESGLEKPKIEEQNSFFDVELIRELSGNQVKDSGRSFANYGLSRTITDNYGLLRTITDDLDDNEITILNYLKQKSTISRKEAVEILSFQKTKVHEILSGLVQKSILERKLKGRSTLYNIKK